MTRLVSSHLHFHVEATIWGRYSFGSVSRARKYHITKVTTASRTASEQKFQSP